MAIVPTCGYHASFERGNRGWDVEALQVNLNAWREREGLDPLLVEDGIFGGRTERVVRTLQRRRELFVDGVAGPRTQKRLALDLMAPAAAKAGLARCYLRGLVDLETTYLVAAVNCSSPGGKDCGWTQRRVADGASSSTYWAAFHGPTAFERTASELVERAKRYGSIDWALLAHNWPAAAERYAAGTIEDWVYTSRGERYGMSDPAPWIIEKGIDGVRTGHEWSSFYVGQLKRFCE